MKCRQVLLGPLIAASTVICLAGCKTSDRYGADGTVTLDGQPLTVGVIQFVPLNGGPVAGGEIRDGKFSIASGRGPVAGKFRVEITSSQKTGRKIRTPAGDSAEEARNIIPARYNSNSELRAEIPSDSNKLQFQLTSQ